MRYFGRVGVVFSVLAALLAVEFSAQAAPPQRITVRGKVYGVRPGQIAVISAENNQPWLVAVPNNPAAITVEGEGGPEMLGPGVFVQFSAEFDTKRRAQGEVTEIMVFTPSEGYAPGVTEQAAVVDFSKDAPDLNLGGGLAAALGDDDDEKEEEAAEEGAEKTADEEKKEPPKLPTSTFLVSGQLRSFTKGEMTIIAGKAGSIRVPVAEDAKVSINSSHYGLAIQGDDIEVDGTIYKQGQLTARSVAIKLGERAPIETKKVRKVPTRTPRGAKPEEAAGDFGVGDPDEKKEEGDAPAEADAAPAEE